MVMALLFTGALATPQPPPRFPCRIKPPACYAFAMMCDYGNKRPAAHFVSISSGIAPTPMVREPGKCFVNVKPNVVPSRKR